MVLPVGNQSFTVDSDAVGEYTINLDLQPRQRWNALVSNKKQHVSVFCLQKKKKFRLNWI